MRDAGATPGIPSRSNRFVPILHDRSRYCDRWRSEATSGRLKGFSRVPTRYDIPARILRDANTLATIHAFWL